MTRQIFHIAALALLTICFACNDDNNTVGPDGDSKYRQYGTPFKEVPETNDIVMYEVNLRAFSPGGDIQGVIDNLDHIEDLGVNVLWLMPIHPIGTVNSVNSPYSIRDYKSIGSEYGTLDDLRQLTDEAHERGIAVIMDWVANHTAWDHPWTSDSTWYTRNGEGDIVHPPGTNWLDVADLNYNNDTMRLAMIDAMKYWLYEANVDGFRCDYADGVPFDFWSQAFDAIDSIPNREFVLFAEGTRTDHFAAGFDLNFSWDFYGALLGVFDGQSAGNLFDVHEAEYSGLSNEKGWLRFTTNHDQSAWDATPVVLFNGIDGALAATVLQTFIGGAPLIYGSEEVGTANNVPFFSNSEINWSHNPDMKEAYYKIYQFYSRSAAAKSRQNTVYEDDDIVCFTKTRNDELIAIIVNVRNADITYSLPPALSNTTWRNVMTGGTISLDDEVAMHAYQYLILEEE